PAVPAEAQPPAPAPPAVPAPVAVPALAPLPSSIAPPPAVNPATPLPVVTSQPVPIEAATPAPEPEAPPADGRVVGMEELPQDLRATLAKFSVSGHVWSEEPGLRLLTVNDRIVREGQDAAPGVRLEQITQDGAVFSLRGWRFRVTGR
ncbi:MAG TPA: general secretion pathway protein GspB, partial [bacterium]